jgi:hypothetical protein
MPDIMPEQMKDWGSYWQIYDTCNIGPSIDQKVNGWFTNFTELASATEVPFLNIRNESIAGRSYTNITSMDKTPWWFDLNSIGLRFIFPDPAVNVASEHLGLVTMSKYFCATLPEHCVVDFKIRSYTFLTLKGSHMPAGHAPGGPMQLNTGSNNSFTSLVSAGDRIIGNRWKFVGNERIPKDTPISAHLYFDDYAKNMLRVWNDVPGIDFGAQEMFPNMPQIEMTLRGVKYEQRPGEFRK